MKKNTFTPSLILVTAVSALPLAALAQWSKDPAAPFVVADGNSEQTQPKVVPTADGGCYISWLDNSIAGYDVRLQRLNAAGVEQWAHNGIIVADRSMGSTTDYDLIIDSAGNAVLAFIDDLSSPPAKVAVQRVSPAGVKLWGAAGALIENGAGNVHVAQLTDGTFGVAWSASPNMKLAHLDASGALIGTVKTLVSEPNTPTGFKGVAICDACAGENGSFIMVWTRSFTNSFLSSKWLYAQKYDTNLNEVWTSNVAAPVNAIGLYAPTPNTNGYGAQGGAVQNGYFPAIMSDGAGGFVCGFYETANTRQAYIQHILPNGTPKFPGNGLSSAVPAGRITIGAGFDYDASTNEYFLCWPESASPTQGNYSVNAQKFDNAGSPLWAGNVTVLPTGTGNQPSFVQCLHDTHGGQYVFGFDSRSATTGIVFGAHLRSDGTERWNQTLCTILDTKSRLTSTRSSASDPLITYGNMPFGAVDSLAQRILPNGEIGFCHADVGQQGGTPGQDAALDNNDFVAFIDLFFLNDARADFGQQGGIAGADGGFDNNDFVVFIDEFFNACQ